jgi:hypothetical protein
MGDGYRRREKVPSPWMLLEPGGVRSRWGRGRKKRRRARGEEEGGVRVVDACG